MERTKIVNPIIFFKGDVSADELWEFAKTFPRDSKAEVDIVIDGSLLLNENEDCSGILKVPANLWILEEIAFCGFGYTEIRVDGDAYCGEDIDSVKLVVAGDLECDQNLDSTDVEVGGDVLCKGNANATQIKAFGDFTCYGNCNSNVAVGGFLLCEGEIEGEVTGI